MKQNLLNEAKAKRDTVSKLSEDEFKLPIDDFILLNFIKSTNQSSRGNNFQSKIISDLGEYMTPVSNKDDCGDAKMFLPYNNKNKFIEVKTSYTNDKNYFGIRNIRFYQDKIDFYIIAVVDTSDDFKTHFFCVKSTDLKSKFNSIPMHGTKNVNMDNSKVSYAISSEIKNGLKKLSEINLLQSDSYEDLEDFFNWSMCLETF